MAKKLSPEDVKSSTATHLGKKPVKGGSPPRERRQAIREKGMSRWAVFNEVLLEDKVELWLLIFNMRAVLIVT